MGLRTLRNNMNLQGKRVLIRVDANVPISKGKAVDGPNGRIARAAVDIDWLSQRGAKVIVLTHLGRPGGKKVMAYSVAPIARRLSELLTVKVKTTKAIDGPQALKAVERLKEGEVLLLENVRFDPREKQNSPSFAQSLASLADLYVNDAFAVSHRAHSSIDAITTELPSYAGPLLAQEVQMLQKVVRSPKQPFVLVVGGLKMTTKLPVIRRLLPQVDHVLIGGALATVFLHAEGIDVGKSTYDEEGITEAKRMLQKAKKKILLPHDVIVAKSFRKDSQMRATAVSEIRADERIVDIGPGSSKEYAKIISRAKTVVWNGPFGYCEIDKFCTGTFHLAKAIAGRTGKATTIVGGGDTGPAIEHMKLQDQFTLLSTGGGAMLAYLAGDDMPAIDALMH
jgi:phosphoglycerate kinase